MTNNLAYGAVGCQKTRYTIFIFTSAVWLFIVATLPLDAVVIDGDTEWHIAAGDLIRELGALPAVDPWSFTAGDTLWVNVSWLWGAGFSKLYEMGGWHFVNLGNAVIYATTIAGLFLLCWLRSGNGFAAIFIAMCACSILHPIPRPLQCGTLLFLITYALFELVYRQKIHRHWLWALVPISLIWVNVHGSVVLGFALMGLYGLVALFQNNRQLFMLLFVIGLASLLASFINPYGAGVYWHILQNATGDVNQVIVEWMPLQLTASRLLIDFYIPIFFLLIIARPVPMSETEKWSVVAFLLLAFSSQRALGPWCILSAPVLASSLAAMFQPKTPSKPAFDWLAKLESSITHWLRQKRSACMVLTLSIVLALSLFTPLASSIYAKQPDGPMHDLSKEVAFIQQHYSDIKFYSDFALGGSLIFQFRGEFPVFVDGRSTTAYPKDVLADFAAFHRRESGWQQRFARRGVYGVMLRKLDYNAKHMRHMPGWSRVFVGKDVEIFVDNDYLATRAK